MRKNMIKIAASILAIVLAGVMVVSVSYAWITLSQSPEVNGISVGVAGRTTILLAPDVVAEADGRIVHYPGKFGETLNLTRYLERGGELQPVSTTDGLHWIMPTYDSETGELKDVSAFTCDDTLSHVCTEEGGYYIYCDFWVVSPDSKYSLRVSMSEQDKTGCYMVELPVVEETEEGLKLSEPQGVINSSVRVGFLTNTDEMGEDSAAVSSYLNSQSADQRYRTLRGVYPEKNEAAPEGRTYRFSIYEPNGTTHPAQPEDHTYWITRPLAFDEETGQIAETDLFAAQLAVQEQSQWRSDENGVLVEQKFRTAMFGQSRSASSAQDFFYKNCIQGQIAGYISSGSFFQRTNDLLDDPDAADTALKAGASDWAVITGTERNVPQRIRMYIWIEGQDADCACSAVDPSQFSLNIELAGATS